MKGVVSFPPTKWDRQGLRATFFSSMLPAHPLPGGGWRAQRDGRGRLDGPLRGPGSVGDGGGFAAVFYNAAFGGPPSTTSWSPSPRRAVGGKFEGRGLLSPTKWDRQGLRQRSSPPCYLPTPSRGWVASAARRKGAAGWATPRPGFRRFREEGS